MIGSWHLQDAPSALHAPLRRAQPGSTWAAAAERRPARAQSAPLEATASHQASVLQAQGQILSYLWFLKYVFWHPRSCGAVGKHSCCGRPLTWLVVDFLMHSIPLLTGRQCKYFLSFLVLNVTSAPQHRTFDRRKWFCVQGVRRYAGQASRSGLGGSGYFHLEMECRLVSAAWRGVERLRVITAVE